MQIVPAVAMMSSHIRTLQPSTEPISSPAWTCEPLIRFLSTIARSPPRWAAYRAAVLTLPTSGETTVRSSIFLSRKYRLSTGSPVR